MQQKILWALFGGTIILFVMGIFFLGSWYKPKDRIIDKGYPRAENIKNLNLNKNDNILKNIPTGWKTFANKSQGYTISYPDDGSVVQLGTSGHEKDVDPTDGACVTVKLKGGYVTVLGKTYSSDQAIMCLRTGVGTDWSKAPLLSVRAFGKKHSADGMKTSSASIGYQKEFYYFNLSSGEKVEFGIEVNEKYTPKVTHREAKEQVMEVLKSLTYIK